MKLVIQMVRMSLSFLKERLDLVSPLTPFLAIATKNDAMELFRCF